LWQRADAYGVFGRKIMAIALALQQALAFRRAAFLPLHYRLRQTAESAHLGCTASARQFAGVLAL
jgi:hypothetical protein